MTARPPEPTRIHKHWPSKRSIAGGILVPLLLIAQDPGIVLWASPWALLPSSSFGPPMLGSVNVLALTCTALASVLLCLTQAKPMSAAWLATCGGALACASALPWVICVGTVPMGAFLLVIGIGVLGFLPIWTAYEWAQASIRALDRSTHGQRRRVATAYALCGALALSAICASAQYLSWRWSLKHDIKALLSLRQPRVDFAKEFTYEWDRVAFLGGFVDDDTVRKLFGFSWTSSELRQLGFWSHRTLVVFLDGDSVAASSLFEEDEFSYCEMPTIILRRDAVLEVRGRTMCRLGRFDTMLRELR